MVYYRYRTFAERLGPANAKSILLHYLGVVALCYIIWNIRLYILNYSAKCPPLHRGRMTSTTTTTTTTTTTKALNDYDYEEEEEVGQEMPDFRPYWVSFICMISQSNNLFVSIFRKYLDFTTYYVIILVVGVNSVIILVLSKHLWRAFFIKKRSKMLMAPLVKRDSSWVSINMDNGGEAVPNVACMDDNFCIEVILAAFDFFRVSDTNKED